LQFEDYYHGWTAKEFTYDPYLYADYRYRFQTITDDDRTSLELEIKVKAPSSGSRVVLTDAYADVCFQDGCKVQAHLRDYSCRPSPSRSGTPTRTRSRTPTRTRSRSAVRTATTPATLTATEAAAARPTNTETPIGTRSSMFQGSQSLIASQIFVTRAVTQSNGDRPSAVAAIPVGPGPIVRIVPRSDRSRE
jgi:hypothetical protein